MRALWSAVVSSALLFILGSAGLHPASDISEKSCVMGDEAMASLLIKEFYPCAVNGDEYMVLSNPGPEAVNLLGWSVSDGEGTITLLGGSLQPSDSFSISENASSFTEAYGVLPDIQVDGWCSGDGALVVGRFRLADAGDVLVLSRPDGSCSDAVAYGGVPTPVSGWLGDPVPAPRDGEVLRRVRTPAGDTDSSADWTGFAESRYGHTDFPVAVSVVPQGHVTCFTSPDSSLDVLTRIISDAASDLRLCSYELSSVPICLNLSEAVSRGVSVRVLVDGNPVGGMSDAQVSCLSFLAKRGAEVLVIGGSIDDGTVRHVGAMHAKYIVADRSTVAVLSENFVEEGVPSDRLFGNRGWGVSLSDQVMASFASAVFDEDARPDRGDVWHWLDDPRCDLRAALPEAVEATHPDGVMDPLTLSSEASVSLYFSPDASATVPFLAPLVGQCQEVVFEQFQAELEWTTRWFDEPSLNPVLSSVADVLDRGGTAKGLFDGSWFNEGANAQAVSYLAAAANASGAGSSFGLLDEGCPVRALHNKGLVLDDACVISSNNWVYASFAKNRELAAMVSSHEAAAYFTEAFMMDWVPDTRPPVANAGPDIALEAPRDVLLDGSCSWDDRALSEMSWDIDGDGLADAWGSQVTLETGHAGTYVVRLVVEDSWGNTAADWVNITVGASDGPATWPDASSVPWFAPAVASACVAAFMAARKLNLLGASTHSGGRAPCSSGSSSQGTHRRSRGSCRGAWVRSTRRRST
jgi:cardiolipin synthase